VFGLGDICNIPTAKTAAAVFSQTPVVAENIKRQIETERTKIPRANSTYDGYASCPIFVGDKKLMLAEFKYGGVPAETFSEHQDVPSRRYYDMKKELLPRAYFNLVPQGLWFGKNIVKVLPTESV
jgi:sulfide:quinone oxidoreductase